MIVTYESLLQELKSMFMEVGFADGDKMFFINNFHEVVASYDDHSINMYFLFPQNDRSILNHHGVVIATFAKNFRLEYRKTYADCMMIQGLWGATNSAATFYEFGWIPYHDPELTDLCTKNLRNIPNSHGVEMYDHSRINSCGEIGYNEQTKKITISVGNLVISNLVPSKYHAVFPNVVNTYDYPKLDAKTQNKLAAYYGPIYDKWLRKRNTVGNLTDFELNIEYLIRDGKNRLNDAHCSMKNGFNIDIDMEYSTGTYSDLVGRKFRM